MKHDDLRRDDVEKQQFQRLRRARLCMISLRLSVLAVLCMAGLPASTAETPAKSDPPKAAGTKKAEPEIPPKTKMALKIAGLVTFVASSCRELEPDYTRFRAAMNALGVAYADLDRTELKGAYLSYALRYKEDVTGNCARALKEFGPGGKVVADLVKPKGK